MLLDKSVDVDVAESKQGTDANTRNQRFAARCVIADKLGTDIKTGRNFLDRAKWIGWHITTPGCFLYRYSTDFAELFPSHCDHCCPFNYDLYDQQIYMSNMGRNLRFRRLVF